MVKNREAIITEEDIDIHQMLDDLYFENGIAKADFIRYCSTYIIVHGMKY
jgi:hypothetical protein